jgi:hypothetical protein
VAQKVTEQHGVEAVEKIREVIVEAELVEGADDEDEDEDEDEENGCMNDSNSFASSC